MHDVASLHTSVATLPQQVAHNLPREHLVIHQEDVDIVGRRHSAGLGTTGLTSAARSCWLCCHCSHAHGVLGAPLASTGFMYSLPCHCNSWRGFRMLWALRFANRL